MPKEIKKPMEVVVVFDDGPKMEEITNDQGQPEKAPVRDTNGQIVIEETADVSIHYGVNTEYGNMGRKGAPATLPASVLEAIRAAVFSQANDREGVV